MTHRVLFATPEIHPFNKIGGLADVSASLVPALAELGQDVRLLLPGYPAIRSAVTDSRPVGAIQDPAGREGCLLLARVAGLDVPAYVLDFPRYFAGLESPYGHTDDERTREAARFHQFALSAVRLALGQDPDWRPSIVHCNDWTSGLVAALLHDEAKRPATVFTIHNLAYQGLFPAESLTALGLPRALWSMDGLEFHGQLSFLKGGLAFADVLNTVSPTYAREILTPEFGCGLDGLLRHRQDRLVGILNGVDYRTWDPDIDELIPARYCPRSLEGKAICKRALQDRFGLARSAHIPLLAVVSRLTQQKGVDLIVDAIDALLALDVQLVVLGTGDPSLESMLTEAQRRWPRQVGLHLGYDEELAHQIVAGADAFLMPSRFEPCGLTQLYSMKYGTIPIVHATGGLADTVQHADSLTAAHSGATGLVFEPNTADELVAAVRWGLELYEADNGTVWRALQSNAMAQDFSWRRSAESYVALYERANVLLRAGSGELG
jgi:starch synthase